MLIYKVTNLINGKIYIGLTTTNLHQRKLEHERSKDKTYFHNAIAKYGKENFKWEILEECDNKEQLSQLEIKYIKQYDSINKGYNLTTGGERGYIKYNTNPNCRTGGNNPAARKIININTLEIFDCITDAAKYYNVSTNNLGYVLNGKYHDCQGYQFEYYNETKQYKLKPLTKEDMKKKKAGKKTVINLSTNETFSSISAAAEKYHCARKGIRECCNEERADYLGFKWKYANLD